MGTLDSSSFVSTSSALSSVQQIRSSRQHEIAADMSKNPRESPSRGFSYVAPLTAENLRVYAHSPETCDTECNDDDGESSRRSTETYVSDDDPGSRRQSCCAVALTAENLRAHAQRSADVGLALTRKRWLLSLRWVGESLLTERQKIEHVPERHSF